MILSVFVVVSTNISVDGAITSSTNYCEQFPTFPECTGWRTIPITDNFWFCEYVDLPTMCKNPPDPQKQIVTQKADYCCRLFEDTLNTLLDASSLYYDVSHVNLIERGIKLPESYPVDELVVWTNKDHYNFEDRVNVYGKFDFGDPIIKKNNDSVNVEFNGKMVISDLQVHDNGWFSGSFFLSDERFFWNGISRITVSYPHSPTLEDPDATGTSAYEFTTGEIKEPKVPFSIIISDPSPIRKTISYKTDPPNPVPPLLQSTIISRITNSDGVVYLLPTHSMDNLNEYFNKISSLDDGEYIITMTIGDFTTGAKFEYVR